MNAQDDYMESDLHDQDPREGGDAKAGADEGVEEQTALLPKSICPDMHPGEELVLRIDKVLDAEYQVSYAPKKKGVSEDDGADNPGGLYD